VLNGGDAHIAFDESRRQRGFTDVAGECRNADDRVQVNTREHDAGIDGRRTQRQINLLAGVQANAGGADDVLQCALFDHELRVTCAFVNTAWPSIFKDL
jgi:hypothetical protein